MLAAIVDAVIDASREEAIEAVRDLLRTQVQSQATLAVPEVGDFGLFPPAGPFPCDVPPVVIDANWFRNDVLRVCRSGEPTILLMR